MNWYLKIAQKTRSIDPTQIPKIIERYQNNDPIGSIAFDYGVANATIRDILIRNGVELRDIKQVNRGDKRDRIDTGTSGKFDYPAGINEYITQYAPLGYSYRDIAKQLGVIPEYVRRYVLNNGLAPADYQNKPHQQRQRPTEALPAYKGQQAARRVELAPLPDWVDQFIQSNPGMSPDWYYKKTNWPISHIIKYMIDKNLPFAPGFLRQVSKEYQDKYYANKARA